MSAFRSTPPASTSTPTSARSTPQARSRCASLNRDGVDYWRNYAPWRAPLQSALGKALDSWQDCQPALVGVSCLDDLKRTEVNASGDPRGRAGPQCRLGRGETPLRPRPQRSQASALTALHRRVRPCFPGGSPAQAGRSGLCPGPARSASKLAGRIGDHRPLTGGFTRASTFARRAEPAARLPGWNLDPHFRYLSDAWTGGRRWNAAVTTSPMR